MKYKNECLSIVMGLALCQGIFANDLVKDIEEFDINSIVYIEDGDDYELSFDSADYLPEGFDPYAYPTDVAGMNYIDPNETIVLDIETKQYLPNGFDAFARN